MFDYRRSHTCGELNATHVDGIVTLSGWVHRRRDHGGLIFIDLRDRFGLTQVLFDPKFLSSPLFAKASSLRSEWVISIRGKVAPRAEGMKNPKLSTGEIEVLVADFDILSPAKTPPFPLAEQELAIGEESRLKYRFLDLRRKGVADNLILRHQVMQTTRSFLSHHGFLEITTPILAKSTPEGARDYLVPSRVHPGEFYALPQSPQIFKQLLMVGGMDRYFQIATCFRDEDLRADRQPEFSQIDLEISFSTPADLMALVEQLIQTLFEHAPPLKPFRQMTHQDCIELYGTDRPDLRFGMPLIRIDSIAALSSFSVFHEQNHSVKALCVKGGASLSRREIEEYIQFVSPFGLKGLSWMKYQSGEFSSSITKFFSQDLLRELKQLLHVEESDLLFIAAGEDAVINQSLDHLRRKLAKDRQLISPDKLEFLWVTDFPLLRWNVEEQRMESEHHPFTSPRFEDLDILEREPLKARALAYDLVLNGYEIGGGSQRIHDGQLQKKIFQILNLSAEEIEPKFGFFVDALQYGTPPHLGIALGLDRIIMLLAKTENIRDVVAFPKTQKASDLMMECPARVSTKQLRELQIKL